MSILAKINQAIQGTPFAGDVFLVGGAVRDEILTGAASDDLDLVTRGNAIELAEMLYNRGLSPHFPVTYPKFGTAMIHIDDVAVELVTARRESYDPLSRKPEVTASSYQDDALRRDFTVNTLMRPIDGGPLVDPLGKGLADLEAKILRTPRDPDQTFIDDPLRMLRAVRFRWKLGFDPAPGLYESIIANRERLRIISFERIRDEILKMLDLPDGDRALADLMSLGIFEIIAPEFLPSVGCEQGRYHHLDVWNHTLLVVKNAVGKGQIVRLACLFHDVAKPATRTIDENGNTRFFGHETVGEEMTRKILSRWKLPFETIGRVSRLVKNHMRLGSSPGFSAPAARRLIRDLGEDVDLLLEVVEADANGLKQGVRVLDLGPIRERIAAVSAVTPREQLESPLSGAEIMAYLEIAPGKRIGQIKAMLTEKVLDGELGHQDKEAAYKLLDDLKDSNLGV